MKTRLLVIAAAISILGCAKATHDPSTSTSAERIFVGGQVLTPAGVAEALAVADGKILSVGTRAQVQAAAGPDTQVVDVLGAWILPGLVDAHAHLMGLGASLTIVDLRGTASYGEVIAKVKAAAAAQPTGWIIGRGWDQNDWKEKEFPDGRVLARDVPGRMIWLRRIDGHAGLASPAAMKAAGVRASTKDPKGGRLLRDGKGNPTGVFVDNAMGLMSKAIPDSTPEQHQQYLELGLAKAAEVGLTGVHDMGAGTPTLKLYRAAEAKGELTLRIYAALNAGAADLQTYYDAGPKTSEYLSVRAVKFYVDGALGSRGAALLADYHDEPGNKGLLVTEPEALAKGVQAAVDAGFQPCIHAIGDRGNRIVLDIYESTKAATKGVRPRIEHAQIIDKNDLSRVASLGVLPSMQPTHATSDMPWAPDRVGEARLVGAYAWQTLAKSGATLVFGSDFPVEKPEPLEGLYAAMARMDQTGKPAGGWLPKQRLSFREALAGFTTGAAYAGFVESRRGKLAPGFDADLTIVRGELAPLVNGTADADPRILLKTQVEQTVVAGKTVYLRDR